MASTVNSCLALHQFVLTTLNFSTAPPSIPRVPSMASVCSTVPHTKQVKLCMQLAYTCVILVAVLSSQTTAVAESGKPSVPDSSHSSYAPLQSHLLVFTVAAD
jgi:hypothetical protein